MRNKKLIIFITILTFLLHGFAKTNKIDFYDIALRAYDRNISFGINPARYDEIFSDDVITPEERRELYETYYKESPASFLSMATLYGYDGNARGELLSYGAWLRQQMERGWPLVASGEYGYHDELKNLLPAFISRYYSYKDGTDILLSKQKSPVYFYFADGGLGYKNRDKANQPIPYTYDNLNDRQKRIYNLTSVGTDKMRTAYFTTINVQSKMTPEQALDSGKYISIISAKSINDFGRRFLLFIPIANDFRETPTMKFLGVVVVGGEAKRDDWTGMGSPTSLYFKQFPLGIRFQNNQQWGMDIPTSVYEYIKNCKVEDTNFCYGPAYNIILVDPDKFGY